eukprot:Awhi_evm1s15105
MTRSPAIQDLILGGVTITTRKFRNTFQCFSTTCTLAGSLKIRLIILSTSYFITPTSTRCCKTSIYFSNRRSHLGGMFDVRHCIGRIVFTTCCYVKLKAIDFCDSRRGDVSTISFTKFAQVCVVSTNSNWKLWI